MTGLSRRDFLLASAVLSVGALTRGVVANARIGAGAKARLPAVGQSWRYAKHEMLNGAVVDTEIDSVSAVGGVIEIQTQSELDHGKSPPYPSWGSRLLEKYGTHDRPAGPPPGEVQQPWGMILVDPHWGEVQAYERPLPLWPTELRPGWSSGTIITRYQTPNEDPLVWQLTMHAHAWESITVPAGHFETLRYTNLIYFRWPDVSEREAALRQENIWFAPEIGRWVARESFGTFREDVGTEVQESSYRWELLSWT
jgi:hypothetical protein